MATITETLTNEQIALMLGWTWRKWEGLGGLHDGERFMVPPSSDYLNERTVPANGDEPLWTVLSEPDATGRAISFDLNDPATLGEAERYCREQGWALKAGMTGGHGAWALVAVPRSFVAEGDSIIAAVWAAIWRASQAEGGRS